MRINGCAGPYIKYATLIYPCAISARSFGVTWRARAPGPPPARRRQPYHTDRQTDNHSRVNRQSHRSSETWTPEVLKRGASRLVCTQVCACVCTLTWPLKPLSQTRHLSEQPTRSTYCRRCHGQARITSLSTHTDTQSCYSIHHGTRHPPPASSKMGQTCLTTAPPP